LRPRCGCSAGCGIICHSASFEAAPLRQRSRARVMEPAERHSASFEAAPLRRPAGG